MMVQEQRMHLCVCYWLEIVAPSKGQDTCTPPASHLSGTLQCHYMQTLMSPIFTSCVHADPAQTIGVCVVWHLLCIKCIERTYVY